MKSYLRDSRVKYDGVIWTFLFPQICDFFMIWLILLLLNTGWLLYKAALSIFMIFLLINIFVELEKKEFACLR